MIAPELVEKLREGRLSAIEQHQVARALESNAGVVDVISALRGFERLLTDRRDSVRSAREDDDVENADLPAFPFDFESGVTKRELFAALALQGMLAADTGRYEIPRAAAAVQHADQLLRELAK